MGNFGSSRGGSRGRDRDSGGYGGGRGRDSGGFGGGRGRDSGRSFGGGRGRDRDRRPTEMHDVICDKCKKECQVPFKPTGDKPVLCSDCFKKEGGSSRGGGMSSEQFDELNKKLDKVLKILGTAEEVETSE